MFGTTLAITTPVTTPKSNPRSSNSWRSSTASSSAVRSRCEVTRQSAARRSPSNRASVTLVLPTSTARSRGERTLLRKGRRAALAPAAPDRRLAPDRPRAGRHPSRVRPTWKVPLGKRYPSIPGSCELALADLLADRLVRLAERHAASNELLGGVGCHQTGVARRARQPLAVELQVFDQQLRRADGLQGVLHSREERRLVLLQVAVVCERKSFEHSGERHQAANRPARAASQQLRDVGVFLLGHQARAGRDLVRQPDEAQLAARPEHDVPTQPAE